MYEEKGSSLRVIGKGGEEKGRGAFKTEEKGEITSRACLWVRLLRRDKNNPREPCSRMEGIIRILSLLHFLLCLSLHPGCTSLLVTVFWRGPQGQECGVYPHILYQEKMHCTGRNEHASVAGSVKSSTPGSTKGDTLLRWHPGFNHSFVATNANTHKSC